MYIAVDSRLASCTQRVTLFSSWLMKLKVAVIEVLEVMMNIAFYGSTHLNDRTSRMKTVV
jgi:hypothetical protein